MPGGLGQLAWYTRKRTQEALFQTRGMANTQGCLLPSEGTMHIYTYIHRVGMEEEEEEEKEEEEGKS